MEKPGESFLKSVGLDTDEVALKERSPLIYEILCKNKEKIIADAAAERQSYIDLGLEDLLPVPDET